MANRNFPSNKIYNMHVMPVHIDAQIAIGASGSPATPSLTNAPGIKSITRLAAGIYEVRLQDNYAKLLSLDVQFKVPVSGGNVTAGSFSVGVAYQITALGSTNFQLIGVPSDVTPAIGVVFVATGVGAGTGTAKLVSDSGIAKVELMGDLENSNNPTNSQGARLYFKCLADAAAAPTFTGSALATHNHNLIVKGGQAASTTNDVATYAGPILGKEEATDATIIGANSAASGGVVGASAGTPAGTISAPVMSSALADPANGSVMYISILLNNSQVQ